MYAGTTVGKRSGQWIGVHQRIDRIARRRLEPFLPRPEVFPNMKQILHFEGNNGPDGIKRKSPSVDEPWHYIDPAKDADRSLIDMILDHQTNLTRALKKKNHERAAFEAAWLAHAVVDGLTPAHHFPLADKIEELFGMPHTERQTVKEKNIIKGENRRDTLKKNWQYWGKDGVFATHFLFEFGVASAILGKRFTDPLVTRADVKQLQKDGYEKVFRKLLRQVLELRTYERFESGGWNWQLGRDVQLKLTPLIVKGVVLGWLSAAQEAEK